MVRPAEMRAGGDSAMSEQDHEHLLMARRHAAQGKARVARQRDLLRRLEVRGQSTDLARDLLASFVATLGQMQVHLDYLEHECGDRRGTSGRG